MRLLLLSDTHQDVHGSHVWPYDLPNHDVLILAGDLSEFGETPGDLVRVLEHFRSRTNKPVLYVPGNHEFHQRDYGDALTQLKDLCEQNEIELLHCRSWHRGDVAFHGCTLWTDFRLREPLSDLDRAYLQEQVGDFSEIYTNSQRFSLQDCMKIHRLERAWLEKALNRSTSPYNVVISHFAPLSQCFVRSLEDAPLQPYFVADCEELAMQARPDLWLYGHLHQVVDFVFKGTRFVNNARGMTTDPNFDATKIVEVGTPSSPILVA